MLERWPLCRSYANPPTDRNHVMNFIPPTAGSISSSNYTWNDLMLKPIDGVGIENPATSTGRRRITRQLSSRDLQQSFNPSHRHSLPMWKMDSTNLLNHKVGRSFFLFYFFRLQSPFQEELLHRHRKVKE